MKTEKLTQEQIEEFAKNAEIRYSHDVVECWAVCELVSGGHIIATNDGADLNCKIDFSADNAAAIIDCWMEKYNNGYSIPDPDWDAYKEARAEYLFEDIKSDCGDEWVILQNNYESETSFGFANTYYFVQSKEGEKSSYGWNTAMQIKDVEDWYSAELIEYAKEHLGYGE